MPTHPRQRAEALLLTSPAETPALPTRDVQELVHELHVYQAELEIQNEELRRAQQELAGARDRYLELYQSMPVGCLALDSQRTIREGNQAAVGLLGSPVRELIGQRLDRFVAAEDGDACYLLLQQATATGQRQRRDLRFRRPDGSAFWADLEVAPVSPSGTSGSMAWRVILVDISERKLSEEGLDQFAAELQAANAALRDSQRAALNLMEDSVEARHGAERIGAALQVSEQRIQQALRVSRSFTFEWQPATDQVLRSASCGPILGLQGSEAVNDTGQHSAQGIHPDDRERFAQTIWALTPAADTYTTEYRVVRGDGSVVVLEETGQATSKAPVGASSATGHWGYWDGCCTLSMGAPHLTSGAPPAPVTK